MHKLLEELNRKESIMVKKVKIIENKIKDIEDIIIDKQLNIDIIDNIRNYQTMRKQNLNRYTESEVYNEKDYLSNINNNVTTLRNNVYNLSMYDNFFQKEIYGQNTIRTRINDYNDFNDFNTLESIKTEMRANELREEINEQKMNKKAVINDYQELIQKLKKIHKNKKELIEKLYMHYLGILKEGKDTRDEGLAWAICEILSLGKKVLLSFLPKYLDEKCVLYLFEVAHLLMTIKSIEKKKLKESKVLFNSKKTIIKDIDKKNYRKTKKILNKIKHRFCNSSLNISQNNSKENKSNDKTHPSSIFREYKKLIEVTSKEKNSSKDSSSFFVHDNPNKSNENVKGIEIPNIYGFNKYINKLDESTKKNLDNIKTNINQNNKYRQCLLLNKEIEQLKKIKEQLKNKEMSRIFNEYYKNNYYQRYNVDKTILLSALIGEDNLKKEMKNQSIKEKLCNNEREKTRLYRKGVNKKQLCINRSCLNIKNDISNGIKEKIKLNSISVTKNNVKQKKIPKINSIKIYRNNYCFL